MANYRAFLLNREGKIAYAQPLNAVDDGEAMAEAQAVPRDSTICEVWDADRFVARFDGRNGGQLQPR